MSRITNFIFDRWAHFAVRHPWRVIGGAVLLVALLIFLNKLGGSPYSDTFSLPNTESQRVSDLLKERFPAASGDSATVVVKDTKGLEAPAERAKVESLITSLRALPEVSSVSSPYEEQGSISPDGTIARITVAYSKTTEELQKSSSKALVELTKKNSAEDFQVEAGGYIAAKAEKTNMGNTEAIGTLIAVIVLLIAFGSVVAMGLPIATALLSLIPGLMVAGILAAFVDLPSFTTKFSTMIGLGVAIDYALLIVTRFREGLADGLSVESSVVKASATAGRAVFFAGTVVVIALMGLWTVGIPFISWLGTTAAIMVALSVAAAVFVLPAVLALVGTRVNKLRIFGKPRSNQGKPDPSRGLSGAIHRKPVFFMIASAGLLILLVSPVLGINLGSSDAGNNPTSTTTRRAYDLLSEGFGPGFNGPILVAVQIDNPGAIDAVTALPAKLAGVPGVQSASGVNFNAARTAATIQVMPTTSPEDENTKKLVHRLRDLVPTQLNNEGAMVLVGGQTAAYIDIADKISRNMPIFFLAVIGLSFLLLMAVFRSLVVPLMASMMNLLSVGGAFGVLVLVFQKGWFAGILGVDQTGPIESFLPMMMFAIVFGLSMDYELFLVTRIHEEYVCSRDNAKSIATGQAATMRVITAAAAVMIALFLSFGMGDQRVMKEFGIGLGCAIFLDAAVVRMLLVPSLMHIMGRANWWFPRWLDRIVPHISVDASEHVAAQMIPVVNGDEPDVDR